MSAQTLFPLFVKLTGRLCLVVGSTPECDEKMTGLLNSGAIVRVVAADGSARLHELHEKGLVLWLQRTFRPDDLDGVTLVIASDRDQSINEAVFIAANERGVLCNVIDQPSLCHFYYPATVRRGNLQIAISTNGLSPALASSIRAELEERFDPLYAEWLERIGKLRNKILRSRPKSHARTQLLQRLASRARFERYARQRAQSEKGTF